MVINNCLLLQVPDEEDSNSDSEAVPRKSFKERYTVSPNDESSSPLRNISIPDKPVEGVGVVMDTVAAAIKDDDDSMVVSKGPPPQDEKADIPSEELVDQILQAMWSYSHAYQISNSVR